MKYYLNVYFRTRNRKIEKNIYFILQEDLVEMLSKIEITYATGFYKLLEKHFEHNFFSKVDSKVHIIEILTGILGIQVFEVGDRIFICCLDI